MIYPTRGSILATAAGAPLVLIVAVLLPGRWIAALAWPLAMLALVAADGLRAARGGASLKIALPGSVGVGETVMAGIMVAAPALPAAAIEVALALDPLLAAPDDARVTIPLTGGAGTAEMPLAACRRGTARVAEAWLRWRGPLELVWRQRRQRLDLSLAILPDLRPVASRAAQLLEREALRGLMVQARRGEGMEYEALVEYAQGMDRRAIDWRQSARHLRLLAKEYRPERNHQILFAIDAGRQMTEPVEGLPRVDRAVSAALLAAWVALKLGDRVGLFAFDARPRVASGTVTGTRSFALLQRLAATIDYSADETNYTFALATLAQRLDRRSLIVLFTEFTDVTSAEFMIRAARRLVAKHLLLVVVLADTELEEAVVAVPRRPEDITRAVTAAALLDERLLVLTRLRQIGVHIIESAHGQVNERLVRGYLDLKRRGLL